MKFSDPVAGSRLLLFLLLSSFLSVSCGGSVTPEMKKKQMEAARDVGEVYMNESQFTLALKELLRAEALDPSDPALQNNLGLTYLAKEMPAKAAAHFKKALKYKPDYTAARNNLGFALLVMEKWKEAIGVLEQVLGDVLYTTLHFPLTNLGWAYYNLGEYEKAADYYERALEKQGRYVVAMRGLARTYRRMERYREALEVLNQALDITPRFPPLYAEMAEIYRSAGDMRSAVIVYKKIIALFPNTRYADDARSRAGDLLLESGGASPAE
ncbi:MAG: hypothetical protein CSB33_01770 [Desulfobacterales bacterium]|nr:MAG: hypothetical protein CSB33_01770 [Desulfobacterales bacterium]